MSQVLTLELSDDEYADLRYQAEMSGVTLTEWVIVSLKSYKPVDNPKFKTQSERELARQHFRRHAGSICLGYATGADNEGIDADLAKAYGNEIA